MLRSWLVAIAAASALACSRQDAPWQDDAYFAGDQRPGGATTVTDATATGLGRTVRNLEPSRWARILDGKRLFQRVWSAQAGLGPLYNAASCAECHFHDGRGGPPSERDPDVRLLTRLAAGPSAHPIYGGQLSERAGPGMRREGALSVRYRSERGALPDGSAYELRRPDYQLRDLGWGEAGRMALSPRMPASLAGLGLLEAIPVDAILAAADPADADRDGISGRPSWVPDARTGGRALGRFGWKAGQPGVEQQIATALREDMGLTSWLRPRSGCTPAQRGCGDRDRTGEVSDDQLDSLTTYVRLLGVPARRADASRGRRQFTAAGCAGCHTPRQVTGPVALFPELAGQVIYPYTDLLLHDMGAGLSDGVAENRASGSEWRTPPLWGLGLLPVIHGRLRLLHDGRARSVEEAILWHDGEARTSRRRYAALPRADRQALVAFVESL
jgi:CxxC motif-containing protein (DUF1111 family)